MNSPSLQPNPFSAIPAVSWIGDIQLPALLLATATSLPFLLLYFLTGVLTSSEQALGMLTWIFMAMHILTLASWLQRARGNLQDIEALLRLSNQELTAEHQQSMLGSRSTNLAILIFSLVFGAIFHIAGRLLGSTIPASEAIPVIINEFVFLQGPPELLAWNYIAVAQFFVIGVAVNFGIVSQSRQTRVLNQFCERLSIDLLKADQLAVVGGPILRALAAPVFLLAAAGPILFVNDGANSDGFYLLAVPTALLLAAFGLTALPPVLTVRLKVIAAKSKELDIIQRYLDGDKQAMAESQISHLQDSFTAVEVLDYRDRINAIWEWPLHGQLLKLMFYLIIPPLAWAAAALVERMIDAALG